MTGSISPSFLDTVRFAFTDGPEKLINGKAEKMDTYDELKVRAANSLKVSRNALLGSAALNALSGIATLFTEDAILREAFICTSICTLVTASLLVTNAYIFQPLGDSPS